MPEDAPSYRRTNAACSGRRNLPDYFYNTLEIRHHLLVRETQNAKSFRFKKSIAVLVGLLSFREIMRFAVEFNDQLDRQANEVGDVVPERDLPPEAKLINSIGL